MPPSRTQNGPTENINGVMDRFQAWTANQPAGPGTHSPAEGVREVTYQEALAAQRLRRPGKPGLAQRIAQDFSIDGTHDLATLLSPQKPSAPLVLDTAAQLPSRSALSASAVIALPPLTAPAGSTASRSKEVVQKAAGSKEAATGQKVAAAAAPVRSASSKIKKAAPRNTSVKLDARPAAARTAQPAQKTARRPAAGRAAATAVTRKTAEPDFKTEFMRSLRKAAPASETSKRLFEKRPIQESKATSGRASSTMKPGRDLAVASKLQPARSVAAGEARHKPGAILRSISINLRLSLTEHSQLRSLAADAHQPMAVYVRECALRPVMAANEPVPTSRTVSQHIPPAVARATEATPTLPARSLSELTIDLFIRMRTFWLGRRIEVVA